MQKNSEYNSNRADRKAAGVFYTPIHIVDYILKQTLAKHDVVDEPNPKILDPACGTGNFLVAAYELLLAKFTDKLSALQRQYAEQQYIIKYGETETSLDGYSYWCQENLPYHIICHCLYGADMDSWAVEKAQTRLKEKGQGQLPDGVKPNLVICDSLIKWEEEINLINSKDNATGMIAAFWSQKYNYIIGNPPYISFGLNRVSKMPADQAQYLRAHYPHSAQYKLSYYALFFERGIAALKPGGYLGFITPDSYLLGRYYSKIREYMLAVCDIKELTLIDSPVFGGVMVGIPVITVLQKKQAGLSSDAATVTANKLNSRAASVAAYQYKQEYFSQQVYKRFRLFFHPRDKAIIDKIEQASYSFKEFTKIRTGMRSLTTQADIKSKSKHSESWRQGLVSSSQVLPFALIYQGDWLEVNPAKLNKGGWDAAVMAIPKIFLRQTGDRLVAAVDRSGLYHLNNIHSLAIVKKQASLEYLVCILNSRMMNFYYQTVTLEKGRSMAQVDIETVEKLPLIIDYQYGDSLIKLGEHLERLSCRLYRQTEAPKTSGELFAEFKRTYKELNWLVYRIYGLTESDIEHIEQAGKQGESILIMTNKRQRGRRD